ncbi:HAMP domain-containing protein, partial [Euzebya sp.]|uniref:HAMP domain-containing protein n=1 Tax=Euzebya sp. TaxID=1971409 RepID=UPI003510D451
MTPASRRGSLALRLAAAFVTVAIAAVVVLAVLIVVATDAETRQLLDREHRIATDSAAAAAARAHADAGGWTDADLDTTAAVAASAEARLVVTGPDGEVVAAPTDQLAEMMAAMHGVATVEQPRGRPFTADVVVDGEGVGTVSLTFPTAHGGPTDQLRSALWRTAVIGTLLATAVALGVAVVVARRLTRPVTALTDAASRLAAGNTTARADVAAPGELGVLAHTFDDMADRLETTARAHRQMVADIAHELRTPLAILHGETEALLDGVTQPDDAALASLHDEIVRLTRLVGDLETLAAADAAR